MREREATRGKVFSVRGDACEVEGEPPAKKSGGCSLCHGEPDGNHPGAETLTDMLIRSYWKKRTAKRKDAP
jgi:hypothetical protein